jgi:hypothetical protein
MAAPLRAGSSGERQKHCWRSPTADRMPETIFREWIRTIYSQLCRNSAENGADGLDIGEILAKVGLPLDFVRYLTL